MADSLTMTNRLEEFTVKGKTFYRWGSRGTARKDKETALRDGLIKLGPKRFAALAASASLTEEDAEDMKRAVEKAREEAAKAASANPFLKRLTSYVSKKERDATPKEDFGWPEEEKFPCRSQKELDSAARLLGKAPADKQKSIKSRLIKIAKRKGFSVPDAWKK